MNDHSLAIFIFKIIPTRFLSRLFGWIAGVRMPGFILKPVIKWFSRKFSIIEEYEIPERGFRSFDEFFTRRLKAGARTIDPSNRSIVSPVDGRLDQLGDITGESIIQAKGISYSVRKLIPAGTASRFIGGKFMTIYLAPSDYHRIHSPLKGKITGWHIIPGRLFTVQEYMVNGLKGLFTQNERLITYIEAQHGLCAVVKVGAMNVGKISVPYDSVVSNKFMAKRKELFYRPDDRIPVEKGGEIGIFHLGSTVILLFENGVVEFNKNETGRKLKLGEPIGRLI